ncbi:MAG: TetR/AcrR family transcriptional regulator [Actinomycetota bacterium]
MARTPSGELETRILDAAVELLTEVGAGALTQRAVAKAANVSLQSIYNRFGSKHDLLDAVANAGFVELTEALRSEGGIPLASIEDPIDNIVEGLARYRRFAIGNPRRYGVMFDADVPGFRISDATLGTAFESLTVLVDAVTSAVDAGRLNPDDPLIMAQMIWAAAHGVLRFELTEVGFVADRAAHYDRVVATMLHGLSTPQPAAG